MTKRAIVLAAIGAAIVCTYPAAADEKTRYKYDALGRIESVVDDTGSNAGATSTFEYDNASNRKRYRIQKGQPSGSNRPPVANSDTLTVRCRQSNSVDVVANDTDPDNDAPIVLVSVSKISGPYTISASISGNRTISATVGSSYGEQAAFNYVIRDPAGATATGRLTVYAYGSPMLCA